MYVKFTKKSMTWASEESFKIYDGSTLLQTSPTFENSATREIESCLTASTNNQYTLTLLDSYGDSWTSGSWLKIEGKHGNAVFKNYLTAKSSESYTLSLYMPVDTTAEWKLTSGSVSGSWTDVSFADSTWTTVTLGSVTAAVSGVQYLRKSFAGITNMAAYELALNYRYGIAAYINGVEVYRDNLPEGTLSSSTLATGSYSSLEYHRILRPGANVASSSSLLAVELHFTTSEGQSTVDFDAWLATYAPSALDTQCFIYADDVTLTASGGSNPAQAFDFTKSNYYSQTSSTTPANLIYAFGGPTPYVNGVRLWPSTSTTYTPTDFIWQGSNDGSSFTNVISVVNAVHTASEYSVFYGYFSASLFSNYRAYITASSSSSIYTYELQPLVCNVQLPTTIEYAQSSYSVYAIYESVTIRPISAEWTGCTISPTPATGMTFDSTTCSLSGYVSDVSTVSYTVQSTVGSTTYSGSFTLQSTSCAGTMVTILRTYKSSATYEAFTITDASGNAVLTVASNSGQIASQDWSSTLCLTGNSYSVTLSSSSLNYWQSLSFLYVRAMVSSEEYDTVLRAKYDATLGLPSTYTFNTYFSVPPHDSWYYMMGSVPASWTSSDVSGWSTGSLGSFPDSSNQIQLYKHTFTVSSLANVAGAVLSLRYKYGCIVYLNGVEMFRNGVTGDLSTSSLSDNAYTDVLYRQISLPSRSMVTGTNYLQQGTNTLAIALVSVSSTIVTSVFDAAFRLMGSESESRVFDYTVTYSSISGSPSSILNYYYSYNMYYSTCASNYFQVAFNNDRREWISSVILQRYYQESTYYLRNVVIKARNTSSDDWTTLLTVTGMTWSIPGQEKRIWLANDTPYNQYRFENFGTGDSSSCYWRTGRIDMRSDALIDSIPALSYSASISIHKDIEMAEEMPNSDYYTDFSVSPTLPDGITLDPYTGMISGTPTTIQSAASYTITARKVGGESSSAVTSIAVSVCTGGKSLITLVARTDSNPVQSSYQLYSGMSASGTPVSSNDHFRTSSALNYVDFCLNHGLYTLVLLDSKSNGWSNPAGYYLSVDLGEMRFEMGQVKSGVASVSTHFSSLLPFQIEYDDWKLYSSETDVADDWNSNSFDDSTWKTVKAADIGNSEAVTVYLRRTVEVPDASVYQVLNVRVRYVGGVVAYFNGRTVARFNLDEDFESSTESLTVHDSAVFSKFHVILSTSGVVTGSNTIAFEIHRPTGQSSSVSVVFDATGVFGVNDCSIVVDTFSSLEGTTPSTVSSLEGLFDLSPVTYGYQANAVGTYIQWTVENLEGSKFNSFAMQTVYARTSYGFSVYGRMQEREDFTSMLAVLDQSTVALDRCAWDIPVAIASFKEFKFEVDDAASSAVYLSSYITQYCKATGTVCEGIDDYPTVSEGQISPSTCPMGYRGYSYRTCSNGVLSEVNLDHCSYRVPFAIRYNRNRYTFVKDIAAETTTPQYMNIVTEWTLEENTELPAGLTLDSTTGKISGIPTEESELTTYTIYGSNPGGTASTTITIQVRLGHCSAEGVFSLTIVGEVATYECSNQGSYVGT